MNSRRFLNFAPRVAGVVLVLAMLAAPSLAQVQAAERCRSACEPGKAARSGCCARSAKATAGHAASTDPAGKHAGDSPSPRYCPGCNGRPLVLDTPQLTITLEPAPLFVPASRAEATASFDVPFAIFHPPRA
jgi:hypothetical protein